MAYGTDSYTSHPKINAAKLTVNGKAPTNIKIRKEPLKWVVSFQIDSVDVTIPYTVHIEDDQGHAAERKFQFQAPAPKGLNNKFEPHPNSIVDGSGFYVTITTDYSVYAGVQQAGGPWYGGTVVEGAPNWAVYFQGIPAGDGYSVTVVVWDNPPKYNVNNDITVT